MKSTDKLIELLESYDNGNRSYFYGQVKKLSRKERAQLVSLARSWSTGGTLFAFELAQRCIILDFGV